MTEPARTLLIIEDDPEIGYLLGAVLGGDDRELHVVATGAEADRIASERAIDLIVLDLILPDVDGRVLITRFRERPETSSAPIVVVSARSGTDIRQDCYALGADVYVEKPFDPDTLAAEVESRLQRSVARTTGALVDHVTALGNRSAARKHFSGLETASSLALIQLDGFLSVTERWGWEVGEAVLKSVTGPLVEAAGDGVFLARLGAGDFLLVAPTGGTPSVVERAERILDRLRDESIRTPDGESFRFTASIGVIEVDTDATLDAALDEARVRLLRAREAGRNQVVWEEADPDETIRRILVAEDDEISATILLHRLQKEGLDVTRCDNGRDVYELALEDTPDLLILDVKMPGMDGFEVLESLRRTPSFSAVPIIMLTSMGSEADVVRGFQLGADDYVLKPFSPVELSARVWRLLRRGRAPAAV